jgi:metallo-beta-lactamase class B
MRLKMLRKLSACLGLLIMGLFVSADYTARSSAQQLPGDESNQPFAPFRIIGNIYYVGTNDLACYLIKTNAGLILIDTGYAESAPIIRANIATLGFQLKDIKVMLSSHAHFDHVGGQADMREATGAQVYASAGDAVVLESGGTKSFHPLKPYKPVKVDHVVKDGGTVRLGGVVMTAHLTPGHTEGNTTWTTTATANGKEYKVVFVGSMSINPGVHLVDFAPWPDIAAVYAKSFQILKGLKCDVFLGPHASFFDMQDKARRLKADPNSNSFIDPEGLGHYIEHFEKLYNDQLLQERQRKTSTAHQ